MKTCSNLPNCVGSEFLKASRFCRGSVRTSIILAACLTILPPLQVRAGDYSDKQVRDIVILVNAKAADKLSPDAFEKAVAPLIKARGLTSTLFVKLAESGAAKSGIDDLIAVSQKAEASRNKALEEQKAKKAEAEAKSQAAVAASHTAANAAAEAARSAHAEAAANPGDPAKVEAAAAKDKEAAAAAEKSAAVDAAASKLKQEAPTNSMWAVTIWTGAKLQNPYSITNGVLKPNNTKTDGFIDVALVHRYVLSSDTSGNDNVFFGRADRANGAGDWDWFAPGQVFPDIEFRVGYVFSRSSTPTNLTVSTIAGGSDLASDNYIGLPFWRWTEKGSWNQQATIELGAGFVTDKEFLALHPNFFVGLGYQFHDHDWTWQTRFGLGAADVPKLTGGSTVSTNSSGLPEFKVRAAPTWGTTITYRLNSSVNLQLGANAYFDTRASWNLSAGISVDPAAAFKSFAK